MADSTSSINNTSTTGNILRITGMATGLDIDGTVKKLMTAEQTKIDKAKQSQQLIQWQKDSYDDIISSVRDFQSTFFDVNSPDTCMISPNAYAAFTANGNDASIATVDPGVGTQKGNYTVQVINTASGANYSNTLTSNDGSSVTLGSKLSTIGAAGALNTNLVLKLNFNDGKFVNVTLNNSDGSKNVYDLVSAINSQSGGLAKASYSELTHKFTLNSAATGNSVTMSIDSSSTSALAKMISPNGWTYSNSISGTAGDITTASKLTDIKMSSGALNQALNFNLDLGGGQSVNASLDNSAGNATVGDLLNKINTVGAGKVVASYSSLTKSFSFQNLTGTQSVTIGAGTTADLYNVFTTMYSGKQGNNADVKITPPGESSPVEVTSQTSNNFSYDGVNYTLTGAGTTSFNVTQDTQKVYDKFSNFLTKYNALVDKIQTVLTDKKDKDYPPLTDAQKATMTTDQITNWNNKAKVGVLHNDNQLTQILTDLQNAFAVPVSGLGLQMGKYSSNSIGLDNDSTDYTKLQEIHISDPQKFKDAISQNIDQLYKLFTNSSTSTDKTTQFNENGIFKRVQNILTSNVGIAGTLSTSATLSKYADFQDSFSQFGSTGLNTLMDQIYQKTVLIKSLNTEYSTMQTSYYNKFSQLETAMNSLNNQSNSLASMLGR